MSLRQAARDTAGSAGSPTVAVMQPYFYPYAGYFRLLLAADIFVIFDDVQFPRRGRVHRCEVPGPGGALEWLTLPLLRQPRDTLIKDLAFASDAREILDRRLDRLPWLSDARGAWADRVRAHLYAPLDEGVLPFLEAGIRLVAEALDLSPRMLRSSTIDIDPALRGQDRVIAVVRAVGGRAYVNPPGGLGLYQAGAFEQFGLDLEFLVPFRGKLESILPMLVAEDIAALRRENVEATRLARK